MLALNYELRAMARRQLAGNWGTPILVCFLYGLLSWAAGMVFCGIGSYLLSGPLTVGIILYSLKFVRAERPEVATLFDGFNNFGPALGLYFWNLLWVLLWSLLLIIPGIIKALSYSMSFYILADNPQIGIRNALNISKIITRGYKGKIFVLGLSFIGWSLLAILTCFIGFLWLMPYIQITFANFYEGLKAESLASGKLALTNQTFNSGVSI